MDLNVLTGGWALWLIPVVIGCAVIMFLAIRGELGLLKKKAAPGPVTAADPEMPAAEGELPLEVILAAAAAYCCGEDSVEI